MKNLTRTVLTLMVCFVVTYPSIQIEEGKIVTPYTSFSNYDIKSHKDTETRNGLSRVTKSNVTPNLVNPSGNWVSNGAFITELENDVIRVTSTATGTYQYAYQVIDVSGMKYIATQYIDYGGTGTSLFRIGSYSNASISWLTAPSGIYDVGAYDYVVVALYVTTGTNKPRGTFCDYKNVQIENGMIKNPYIAYGENAYIVDDEKAKNALYRNNIVKTIAHRGDYFLAPEGTKMAYIEARKRGHEIAENDLRKTNDNVFVMWHGANLDFLGELYDLSGYEIYTDGTDFYFYDAESFTLYTFDGSDYINLLFLLVRLHAALVVITPFLK